MRDYIIGAFKQQGPQINFFLYLALKKCHLLIKAAKEMILDHMECVEARKASIRCVGHQNSHRRPSCCGQSPSHPVLRSPRKLDHCLTIWTPRLLVRSGGGA